MSFFAKPPPKGAPQAAQPQVGIGLAKHEARMKKLAKKYKRLTQAGITDGDEKSWHKGYKKSTKKAKMRAKWGYKELKSVPRSRKKKKPAYKEPLEGKYDVPQETHESPVTPAKKPKRKKPPDLFWPSLRAKPKKKKTACSGATPIKVKAYKVKAHCRKK